MLPKVSVVMPALNEEANLKTTIEDVLDGLQRAGLAGEIIVVNDGSTDKTGALLVELQALIPNLRVLTHLKPLGIGRSFWDGVLQARGDLVTLMPGDGENDAYEILRYVPLLESVDVVVPFVFNRQARGPIRRLVSYLYRQIIQISFGLTVNYFNGTVLYRTNVLRQFTLTSDGFFYQAELVIRILRAGYLFAEVPYGLKTRTCGQSKAIKLRSLIQVIQNFSCVWIDIFYLRNRGYRIEENSATARRIRQFMPDSSSDTSPQISAPPPLGELPA